jgi:hypothetical protein
MTNYTVRVRGEQSLNSANAKFLLSFISNGIRADSYSMYTREPWTLMQLKRISELFFEKFINE